MKKFIICFIVVIILIFLLPYPQIVERTYYGVDTENEENVDITIDMKYLRFLLLDDKMYGTITVKTKTETFNYGEYLHYTGQSHSENSSGDFAHDFSGWYYNDTMYMKEYENGIKSQSPIGMEPLMIHISSDFNKIIISHNTVKESEVEERKRYVGSVEQSQVEEAKKYFSGYYD